MKQLEKYIRVGVDYFKEVYVPMTRETLKTLQKWNRQTIIDDFGKESIDKIKKYDGFCCIPSHEDFQKVIKGFYNRYESISYTLQQGNWDNIEKLLKHIFCEHYEIALDYFTILWQKPTQVLPILCLVSEEKNTGKSTFLDLLKAIFERNMTLNTNQDFRSNFNADWAGKLIIAIDEVLLDKKEDSEHIKNLSTAKYFKVEAKGKDKKEIDFFGKFILCSNNEENFVKIDSNEIRYWVRQIPTLGNNINPKMIDLLRSEVPAFAHYLSQREIVSPMKTRMWFTKQQIHTKALDVLIKGNKTSLEKELEEMIQDEFTVLEKPFLCYTAKNLVEMLKHRGFSTSSNYISKTLNTKYNMFYEKNSSYEWYRSEIFDEKSPNLSGFTSEKGRYFKFEREKFLNQVES